ncbi:MAG: Hsp70 family protein, partial [Methanophagales archaeon]|nr:Hsp70 family protein [Methanophagales archaeon]
LMPEEEGFLGDFMIDIEPMPMHESKIEIAFEVGEEFGILRVTAKDQNSGNERKVKMEATGRLSKKEKNRWMKKMLKMQAIKVRVVNVETEDVLSYYLNPNAYIGDVKQELMQKGILADGFGIFYDDAELDDDRQVKEIGIKAGSALEVMQK